MKFKKIKKRTLTLLSAIVLLCGVMISSGIPQAFAETIITTTNLSVATDTSKVPTAYCKNADGSDIYYYGNTRVSNSGSLSIDYDKGLTYKTHDGSLVYCIGEYFHKIPDGSATGTLSENIPTNAEYQRYISSAVAGMSFKYAMSDADKYYVTQCAVRALYYNIPASAYLHWNSSKQGECYRV